MWVTSAAATANSLQLSDWLSTLINWGPGGIIIILIMTGKLAPKSTVDAANADRDSWKSAYFDECAAHSETRSALAIERQQTATSNEAARVTTQLLEGLQHQRKPR